jgi:hypothetical protein
VVSIQKREPRISIFIHYSNPPLAPVFRTLYSFNRLVHYPYSTLMRCTEVIEQNPVSIYDRPKITGVTGFHGTPFFGLGTPIDQLEYSILNQNFPVLRTRGIPTVPATTGVDGGMNATFLATDL